MGKAIDQRWYKQLAPLSIETLLYLKSNLTELEEQRRLFLNGEIENPFFDYSHIDISEIELKKAGLSALRNTIEHEETNEVVRSVYIAKIDEYLAHAKLLKASFEMSQNPTATEAAVENFTDANEYLYGVVSQKVCNLTLRTLGRKLTKVPQERTLRYQNEYEMLVKLTQNLPDETYGYQFSILKQEFLNTKVVTDIREVVTLFEEALRVRGLSDTWRVEVDETGLRTTFSVVGHKRIVAIPGQEFFLQEHGGRLYTVAKLRGLIAHEIDTHAVRRFKGRRSTLWLLGAGLDRYDRGDEGLATYRAQKEKGTRSFAGFLGHLSMSVALGMEYGGAKKNFAELYVILRAYFLIVGNFDESIAATRAWHACWRVFRGSTCSQRGVVFLKDALYREGNIRIHQLLATYPNAEADLNIGNFDPTRYAHVCALLTLGLLPHDPWEKIATDFCGE